MHCQQNTIIAGSEHCEHSHVSAGLVPLTLKFQFSIHVDNFEQLHLMFSSLTKVNY